MRWRQSLIESLQTNNYLYQHLGYGKHSIPLGVILDKYCEWLYLCENQRIFPDRVQGAGSIFNMQVVFDENKTVNNNVLLASAFSALPALIGLGMMFVVFFTLPTV